MKETPCTLTTAKILPLYRQHFLSPLGTITLAGTEDYITHIDFSEHGLSELPEKESPTLALGLRQLQEYFDGKRTTFSLPLAPAGTDFQQRVWTALLAIPYGETRSYKDIALAVESPKAFRAVGGANNKNPISIVIPCHRVIGADGALVGYGSGLGNKTWLLRHEKAQEKA